MEVRPRQPAGFVERRRAPPYPQANRDPNERRGAAAARILNLTPRQTQIMELIVAGLADKEIAARLRLSHSTVRTHIQRIYDAHGLRNRAEAAAAWMAASSAASAEAGPAPAPARRLVRPLAIGILVAIGVILAAVTVTIVEVGRSSSPGTAEVLPLVNADRAGLPPLTWSSCLAGVAAREAERRAARGYVDPAAAPAGPSCGAAGGGAEVAAYWSSADARAVNRVLTANPATRGAIRGPFQHLGAAWAVDGAGTAFLVLILN